MSDEQRLQEMLGALRAADSERGASSFAETRLRAAFREEHAAPHRVERPGKFWFWMLPALAAMAMFAFLLMRPSSTLPVAAPRQETAALPAASTPEPAQVTPVVKGRRPAAATTARRKARVGRTPPVEVRAVAEEPFLMLPYAPPMQARDWGQVMRVRVPRQSLRALGLPVNEERITERVPADLLLGEDGVPRAIRVVNAAF